MSNTTPPETIADLVVIPEEKPPGIFLHQGKKDASILVIVDPPSAECLKHSKVISAVHLAYFATLAKSMDFVGADFTFLSCSPYMPDETFASKSKQTKFLKEYRAQFLQIVSEYTPKMILTLGNLAAQQVAGKSLKITRVRGQILEDYEGFPPVLHTLGVGYVQKSPQNEPTFITDFTMMKKFQQAGFQTKNMNNELSYSYRWCTDLTDWVNDPPQAMFVDTETTGLDWTLDTVFPFTVQLCRGLTEAIMIPCNEHYYPELGRNHTKLMADLKWLLENKSIKKLGHHMKFDYHMLKKINITMENWWFDTIMAAFAVDENQTLLNQAECVRRYVPLFSGYSDAFDSQTDKSQMIHVDKDELLRYGCLDALSGYHLASVLQKELAKDKRQWDLFMKVQMPALRTFADTLETNGMFIDEQMLQEFGDVLAQGEAEQYQSLIKQVPAAVKRKHLEQFIAAKKPADKALQFSRSEFVVDILFSKEGFGFKPVVFTKGTKNLADKTKRVPSVSAKDHLPYFQEHQFVVELMEYQKLQKMRSTYVGVKEDKDGNPTGFWQYIRSGKVYPSYHLHKTATGRSCSVSPNGQNLPKRGTFAKAYRKIFVAPEGWTLVQADFSQAEIRFVAWMANEPTMIQAYLDGKDLHAITASEMMGISYEEFLSLDEKVIEQKRYEAKAIIFGLIYKMSASGYKEYAYTNYGIKVSLEDSKTIVSKFFRTYKLLPWQDAMVSIAHSKKYVRSLHGALRRLPNIDSKDSALRALAERQSVNCCIQRIASDMGIIALTRIHQDMVKSGQEIPMKFCMFIHDALVALVRDGYLEEGMAAIKYYMENIPLKKMFGLEPPIPLVVDVEAGKNFGELVKQKHVVAQCPEWFGGD